MSRCTGDLATWQGVFSVAILPNPHLQVKAHGAGRRYTKRQDFVDHKIELLRLLFA